MPIHAIASWLANQRSTSTRTSGRSFRHARRPVVEVMEGRMLLTTYYVLNIAPTGPGSLAQAIDDSNGDTTQANIIQFDITGTNPVIDLTAPLENIIQPVTFDGTTQPGYMGSPIVQIVGSAGATDGLNVTTSDVTIKGLVVSGFSDAGIILGGTTGGDTVSNCYIGTNVAGTAAQGNGTGIRITCPNNIIGGTAAGSLDLISGNNPNGVAISTAAATGNVIEGDYIGTDISGTKAVANYLGLSVNGAETTVGGSTAAARNIISGNTYTGVAVYANQNLVEGNYIGTDTTGTKALGNYNNALSLDSEYNTVGGTSSSARNIISATIFGGNYGYGIIMSYTFYTGIDNLIEGNYIGTDVTGTVSLGNSTGGIDDTESNNTIGGTVAGSANLISGNGGVGIISNSADQVLGNLIGVDANGASLGNKGDGIDVISGVGVIIGSSASGAGNIISNNANGIVIEGAGKANDTITDNTITNNSGTGVQVERSTQVSILGNSIAGNQGLGIYLDAAAGQPNPNNLIPAPYLSSVTDAGNGQETLTGIVLPNQPNTAGYLVQVFANPSYEVNGTSEGEQLVGETTVSTNAQSRAPFTVTYTPVSGLPALTATVTDANGNTSQFSIEPPAPTNIVPVSLSLNENSNVTLSSANNTNIIVSYNNDSGLNNLQFSLGAGYGTLTLATTANLTGSGDGTSSLSYTGGLSDINNALDGLVYTPETGFSGTDQLTITTNNLAGDELGGDQSTTSSTALVVVPLSTSPTITAATTTANTESTSGLVITPGLGTPGVSYFQITGITDGTLYQNDGATPINDGDFITTAQGAAGLKFSPSTDFVGQASFTAQGSTTTDPGGSGFLGTTGTGLITVNLIPSTTSLSGSSTSVAFGQPLTLTATLTPTAATGTVTFLDGTTSLGTATLSNGSASFTTSALSVGDHSLVAQYGGDTITQASTSSGLLVSVTEASSTTMLSPPTSPVDAGSPVVFTATVSPSTATGSVTFFDGSTSLGSGTLSGGVATFSISTLAVGAHSILAEYQGDGNDLSSTSTAQPLTVQALATTTSLSGPPDPVPQGQPVTLTATVNPAAATGTIAFFDGSTLLGGEPLSDGTATFTISSLFVGNHNLTAVYGGDATYATSTSTALPVTITTPALTMTSTALSPVPASLGVGQSITFTATVSPSAATGSVDFFDGMTALGNGTLAGGIASFTSSSLLLGSHSITAEYEGDSNFNASASAVQPLDIVENSTATSLVGIPASLPLGTSITLTAVVSPTSATGAVSFLDGSTTLGTGTLAGGVATYTISTLAIGNHVITAEYLGDADDIPSTSTAQSITVQAPATTTSLSGPSGSVPLGQAVDLTATVNPSTATGTVTFFDGATVLGSEPLSGGTAAFTTSSLSLGNHDITAAYGGDASDAPSTSAVFTVNIASSSSLAPTTTTLSPITGSFALGQPVPLTATVSPAAATGNVTFLDNSIPLGSAALVDGTATFTTSSLAVGSHSITAEYQGDLNYASSASTTQPLTIARGSAGISLIGTPASVATGSPITLTALVSPSAASGTVVFVDGGTTLGTGIIANGIASYVVPSLNLGSHAIVATYSGDADYSGATSAPAVISVTTPSSGSNTSGSGGSTSNSTPGATTTLLQIGQGPTTYGQGLTFTVQVEAQDGSIVDGGQVRFIEGNNQVGVAPVSNGVASLVLSTLEVGTQQVQADFDGNATENASVSSPVTVVVESAVSQVTLSISPSGTSGAAGLSMVARVAPWIGPYGQVPAPTGTVQFFQGEQLLGQAAVGSNGEALLVTPDPANLSDPTVYAVYLGDSRYLSARSASVNLLATVGPEAAAGPEATTTHLTVAVTRPKSCSSYHVVLRATVYGAVGESISTGSVTFTLSGSRKKVVVPIKDGVATMKIRVANYRHRWASAAYSGAPDLSPSDTSPVRFRR